MAYETHLHKRHRGLVPTDQLGTGTASASNFLRGDGQWHSNYVQRISSSSSNYFIGDVNFRAGTGVAFAASSNDITISATGGGGGGPTSHTILSSTHTDTLAGSVARGSIIRGNGTPLWEALPIGGSAPSNAFLSSNGTDAFWEWPAPVHRITSSSSDSYWGQVDIRAGSGVALARSSNTITISSSAGAGGGGGASALTVTEEDGSPSVASVDTIKFPNGSVTDLGGGDVMVRDVPQAFIGAYASSSGTTNLGTGAYTAIALAAADTFDSDGFHDPSSNNTRMTIPAGLGGKYLVTAQAQIANAGSSNTDRRVAINKNGGGTILLVREYWSLIAATTAYLNGSVVMDLAAGDYIEMMGFCDVASSTGAGTFSLVKLDSGKVGSGIGAKAYNSTTQSINTATDTPLTLDSEDFDTDGFHSISSNTSRMTIPAGLGGKYLVVAATYAPFTGGGFKYLSINKNGNATALYRYEGHDSASIDVGMYLTQVFDLAAGDYLEMWFNHNQGSSQNVGHASARRVQTEFSIMRLDSGSGALTNTSAALAADVNLNNTGTWFDGPSLSLGTGVWLITGHAAYQAGAATVQVQARLYDGTTVHDHSIGMIASSGYRETLPISVIVTVAAPVTMTLQAQSDTTSTVLKRDPGANGYNLATRLMAVRIG